MWPFFKKDFLIYWRDRKELFVQLATPIVLIIVLGFAMPGWVENSNEPLQMSVALVNKDDEDTGLKEFMETLDAGVLEEEAVTSLMAGAEQLSPITLLMQMLNDEQVNEFVETLELDSETALQRLKVKDVVAIITIPEGFTRSSLNKMLLDEGNGAVLKLTADEASLKVNVLQDMLEGFRQTLNFQTAISQTLGEEAALLPGSMKQTVGGMEIVDGVEMLTSFQYFAMAFAVLFGLFTSLTTATKAGKEKREHVFERILLSGNHPFRYLAGKIGSTFGMSLLLLTIILLVSHLILNLFPERLLQFWLGMAIIIILFSLCVASLVSLFTSLIFRMKKDQTAIGISILLLILMGAIGGGFAPIYILPDWLRQAGEWTPNGLALSLFIQWVQDESFANLTEPLLKLIVITFVLAGLGIGLFPRRGRI